MAAVEVDRHLHAKVFRGSEKVEDFKLGELEKIQEYADYLEANTMAVEDLAEKRFKYYLNESERGWEETDKEVFAERTSKEDLVLV